MTQSQTAFLQALHALEQGEAVIFPTDTLFGLGISVCHASSPEILYRIKQRDHGKPIAWLIGDASALDKYGEGVPSYVRDLIERYWPGPLTVIVRASKEVPRAFCSMEGTIGLRMPDGEVARKLIEGLGCPIATTSANVSGHCDARSFSDLEAEVCERASAVLDDGQMKNGIASTVLDCTSPEGPVLLREGAIVWSDINSMLKR